MDPIMLKLSEEGNILNDKWNELIDNAEIILEKNNPDDIKNILQEIIDHYDNVSFFNDTILAIKQTQEYNINWN